MQRQRTQQAQVKKEAVKECGPCRANAFSSCCRVRLKEKYMTVQFARLLTLPRDRSGPTTTVSRKMREGLRSRTNASVHKKALDKEANGSTASGVEGVDSPSHVEKTDYSLWRLRVEHGRQTWHYITPEQATTWPQSVPEKHHLGLETVSTTTKRTEYSDARASQNFPHQRQFYRLPGTG